MRELNCQNCIQEKKTIPIADSLGKQWLRYCPAVRQIIDRPEEQFCYLHRKGLRAKINRWIERRFNKWH